MSWLQNGKPISNAFKLLIIPLRDPQIHLIEKHLNKCAAGEYFKCGQSWIPLINLFGNHKSQGERYYAGDHACESLEAPLLFFCVLWRKRYRTYQFP